MLTSASLNHQELSPSVTGSISSVASTPQCIWNLESNVIVQEPHQNEYYQLLSGCIRINYVNKKGESN